MIAPVVPETRDSYKVKFPQGEWYDYWSSKIVAARPPVIWMTGTHSPKPPGVFLRMNYTCEADKKSVRVRGSAREGTFQPWWRGIQVTVFGADRAPRKVRNGEGALGGWRYDAKAKAVTVSIPDSPGGWELRVNY